MKYRPWAIIDTSGFEEIEDNYSGQVDNNFALARLCDNKSVRYLTLCRPDDHNKNKMLLSVNQAALLINSDMLNDPVKDEYLNVSNIILDLLIDEENGIWEVSKEGKVNKRNGVATTKYL